jgi:hypothetical protein
MRGKGPDLQLTSLDIVIVSQKMNRTLWDDNKQRLLAKRGCQRDSIIHVYSVRKEWDSVKFFAT